MKLTSSQIQLIRSSWNIFRNMDPVLIGEVFYSKLFLDFPKLRRSYPADIVAQYPLLLGFVSGIVRNLEEPETLQHFLSTMVENHKTPTVAHCQKLGRTLQWTLKQGLGNDWNSELETAWIQGIELVIFQMCYKPNADDKNTPYPCIVPAKS